jgi:hypothetical protein
MVEHQLHDLRERKAATRGGCDAFLEDGGERGQEAGWKTENGKLKTENGLRELPRALLFRRRSISPAFHLTK